MKRPTRIVLGAFFLLALWVGWHIHRWGRPILPAFERVAPDRYRVVASRETIYVADDTDGDGSVDRVYPEGRSELGFRRPAPTDPETRWLVVCLDGAPYDEIQELWQEGYFREFFSPSELISPFPSDSETSLTDLLHAPPVPGYEHRYFSRAENRLQGGVRTTLSEERIPYLALFDHDLEGPFKGIAYLLPRRSYRAELGQLRRQFLQSTAKLYLAHIGSGDAVHHILTRDERRSLLLELDALLRELYFAAAGRLRITLFSDHSTSGVASRRVEVRAFLAERGWRLTDSLQGPRDVVVPAYGLVGFLAVYCQPESAAELARTLAAMEGVDLAVWAGGNGVVIESQEGRARLDWTEPPDQFRYQIDTGDPLALKPLLAELARAGKVTSNGYVADRDLFAATIHHRYPDPAYRLWQWASNHVLNRADVLVSLAPGYHHGAMIFDWIVTLRGTHGGLDRAQSVGFAMSTDGPLPAVLRNRDLLPENLPELKAAGSAGRTDTRRR